LPRRDGSYAGYDKTAFTSDEGGKARAVKWLLDTKGYASVAVVGDGATDMEARPPASVFVGFGGNVERDTVKEGCDWWVTSFHDACASLK
jgi:phosphoserine phosphatase